MKRRDFIEPSLENSPALRLEVTPDGRVSFLVHGIVRVYSLADARDLLTDRRVPRTTMEPMTIAPIPWHNYDRPEHYTTTAPQEGPTHD